MCKLRANPFAGSGRIPKSFLDKRNRESTKLNQGACNCKKGTAKRPLVEMSSHLREGSALRLTALSALSGVVYDSEELSFLRRLEIPSFSIRL